MIICGDKMDVGGGGVCAVDGRRRGRYGSRIAM